MKKFSLLLTILLFSVASVFAQTITTSPIAITTKCSGDTVKVIYTITGTFTAGNIFTAQLSNATGAFTSPVNIGTLTSTAAGSIIATIPTGTTTGTGYKIRVVSNTPVITGLTSTSTLTINAVPVAPTVTPAARCSTGVVTLSAIPGTNEVIKWYSAATGGTLYTTASSYTTTSITANTTYYVLDSNTVTTCIAASRVAVLATVNALPAAPAVTPAASCNTGVVTLSATPGTNEVIKWYSAATGGTLYTTANSYTTPSITANTTYYVLDSNIVTKCVASSRVAVLATVNALPVAPTVTPAARCSSGVVTLSATPGTNEVIKWYSAATGGTLYTTANSYTTPSITANTTYYVLDSNTVTTCIAASRVAVLATVNPIPVISTGPTNSLTSPLCSGFGIQTLSVTATVTGTGNTVSYQWYKGTGISTDTLLTNTAPFTSATTAALTLTNPSDLYTGNYYVKVTSSLGSCDTKSNNINVVINPNPKVTISASLSSNLSLLTNTNLPAANTSVTFAATPTDFGNNPTYQWYKNSTIVTDSTRSTYKTSSWGTSGDSVWCIVKSASNLTTPCYAQATVKSNTINLDVDNTTANTTSDNANPGTACRWMGVSFSINNKGYFGLGSSSSNNDFTSPTNPTCLADFWEFSPETNSWAQKANFPGGGRKDAFAFSIGDKGYVGTGTNQADTYFNDFWQFDPIANTWTPKANFGGGLRSTAKGFSIGKYGYVGLGASNGGVRDKAFWRYNSEIDSWTSMTPYPGVGVYRPTGFSLGRKGYLGGGETGAFGFSLQFYEFDPEYNNGVGTWTQMDNIPQSGGSLANGRGYFHDYSIGSYGYVGAGMGDVGTGQYAINFDRLYKFDPTKATGIQWSDIAGGMSGYNSSYAFSVGNKAYVGLGASHISTRILAKLNHFEFTPTGTTIKTQNPSIMKLCKGSTFNVSYTIGAKEFNSGNKFIVQLSDEFGTFSKPIDISDPLEFTISSTIAAKIPTEITAGNKYRIRVVGTNPYTIGYVTDAIGINEVSGAGTIGIDHTVPYPAELTSDAINNVTLPTTTLVELSSNKPYTWQKTINTITAPWTDIPNANEANYNLPLTAQVDTFYRRLANFSCSVSVPSNVVGIKVFSAANNKLNGSISGMVKTPMGTGVVDINITIQKTTINLKGSPQTKVYSTVTGSDGKYIIPNIFYGDLNNGDPVSVSFIVKATKANHDIQNSNGVITTLSNTNFTSTNIDFTDYTVNSVVGAVTTSMNGVNGGAMDSVNSVKIVVTRVNGGSAEIPDTTGSQGYGKYAITVVDQIPYKFTPVYKNHKFIPAFREMLVNENKNNIDFYDSTFNTISGVFRASGGSEIIGKAVIKFEDTVNNRKGVKFTKTITTNTDGSYSVTLPARKYKATIMDFIPATNQTNDIDVAELIEFFNVRLKDSSFINNDTTNAVKNFIFHRAPVLTFQNLADTCGKKVFRQNQNKTFIVNIWEGNPFHNYKVVTDSIDRLRLVTNVAGDFDYDTTYYNKLNGSDTITLKGGSPNSFAFEDYLKFFKLDYTDKFHRSATSLEPQTVVLGLKSNRGTFVTISPEVPLLILHAPPGDQSSCTWTQNTTNETEMSLSFELAGERSIESAISFGVKADLGIGFATETDIDATVTNTLTQRASIKNTTTAVFSTSSSTSYSTEPGGGDVYVGAALNLKYAIADELIFNDTLGHACELFNKARFVVAPNGFATTYTYSEGQITDVIVPTLQAMADNADNVADQKRYMNQVSVWNQVVDNNTRNKARASFIRNRSFDGNAGPIVESTTESSSFKNSLEFTLEIETAVAFEAEAKISNTGVVGKSAMSIKLGMGGSLSTSTTRETSIEYTLDDDEEGDYFSVDIKKDPVYKTPVFELVAGTSSCPAEDVAQSRDMGRLDIPAQVNGVMNKVQTNIPSTNEAVYKLLLRNLSESRETRTYNLEFDQASNPEGAIVTIGGNPSNSAVSYTIPYLGTQIVTVTVRRNPFINVFSYEALRFVMNDGCEGNDEEEVSENTISAYFASPCSNITLVSPTEGWVSNASNNNVVPITFNGYAINNLQSVTLQYAHTGRGDWQSGFVLNQSDVSNRGTQNINWDISDVEDGNYEIRLMLQCSSGSVFSTRYAGIIDRKAPQLFGAPQPADRLLSLGDDISYSFDENIVTNALNDNKVKLTKINNGVEIPVQVTGFGNRVNIVPNSDLFANYYGDTLRVVIKNISDLYGNTQTESDTLEFLVGGSTAPIASNVKKKRVSISNVNPLKTSVFENSGDSLRVKFRFDTASNTTTRTVVRYIVGGTAQHNSGYTVSYSNGQTLATVYNGTEGSIVIPAYQDSAVLSIKPIGDLNFEPNETIMISLILGGDYTISDKYLVKDTIKNDDYHAPIITANRGLCPGGSIALTTPTQIDGINITAYQWKLNSTVVGTSTNTISVNTPGTYTVKVTTANGFTGLSDSFKVVTSVSPVSITNMAICRGLLPYRWNGLTINASGTYSVTLSNSVGCDSIATLVFTIKEPTTGIETIYTDEASYIWHDVEYYTSNDQATFTEVNAAGCDSVVTLHLTIANTCLNTRATFSVSACNSYTWHGMRITTSQTLVWYGVNAAGCDSIETLNLVIKQSTSSVKNVSVCSNQLPYVYNGYSYTRAGTYSTRLTNVVGCDSVVKIILTIKYPTSSTRNVAVCNNQLPYVWNGLNLSTSGNYSVTLTNAVGCDSVANIVFTKKNTTTSSSSYAACSNQLPYVWNGLTLNTADNYSVTLINAAGCDSVATLNFSIKNTTTSLTTTTICSNGLPYAWNGQALPAAGTYSATLTGSNGCDSVATIVLSVKTSPIAVVNANGPTTFCTDGSVTLTAANQTVYNPAITYLWSTGATTNSIVAATTGSYSVKVSKPNGCSTTSAPVNVTLKNRTLSTTTLTVCSNQLPYSWNGLSLNAAGIYTATITNAAGCDLLATIIFSVKNTTSSLTSVTICSSELPYVWNTQNYTSSGNYTVAFAGSNGCDSLATLALNVNQTPVAGITTSGPTTVCSGVNVTLTAANQPVDESAIILPLDLNGSSVLAVGLRKLKSNYNGSIIRLRRGSDNAEQDFGSVGINLDVNAINAWLQGSTGYCVTLYNQSGNGGEDITQYVQYKQPLFVANGINNRPTLHFYTSMSMSNDMYYPIPYSAIYGSRVTGVSERALSSKNNNWLLGYWGGYEDRAFFNNYPWVSEGYGSTQRNMFNIYAATQSWDLSTVYKNGNELASNNNGLEGPNGIQLNGNDYSEKSDVDFTDVLIYNTDLQPYEISQVNQAISSYYGHVDNSGVNYLWSNGATTTSIVPTISGTYTVTATAPNGCSLISAPVNVTILTNNTYAVTGGGSHCDGGTGNAIGLDGSEVGVRYQLKLNGGYVGQPQEGTGAALDFGVFTNQGRYTIDATNTTTWCTNAMSGFADINIISLPNFAVTPTTASVCIGGTVQFTASATNNYCMPNNGYPYFANISEVHLNNLHSYLSGSQSQAHFNEPVDENTTTLVAGQSYEFTMNTNGGATTSVWIDYNNNRLFEPSEWVSPLFVGSSYAAMINVPAYATTGLTRMRVRSNYYWQISAEDACSDLSHGSTEDYMITIEGGLPPETLQYTWNNGASIGNTFVATPSASTEFTVSTTSVNTGCTKSITIPITVNALPNAPVIVTSGASTLCAGSDVTLTLQGNEGAINPTVPLDEVNGASLAVGLRKLNSNYNGPALRLRRSSDDAEQDFGFTGNNLDVNAITTWLGGADGYCTTLYDQSNNGGNVTQAINDKQPIFVLSGINNKPVLHFNSSQLMNNQVNYSSPFTAIYGVRNTGGNSVGRVLTSMNNNWLLGYWTSTMDVAFFEGWVNPESDLNGLINSSNNDYTIYAGKSNGSISSFFKNGNLLHSSNGGVTGPNGIAFNDPSSNNEVSNFDITDLIIYPTDLSTANIVALNNSIGQYYGSGTLSSASYTWSNGTTGSSTTVNEIGSYTVTKTNNSGCSITSEPIVIGKMTVQISGNETTCAGTPANIYIDVNGDGPWSGILSDGTPFSGANSPIMVSVSPNITTNYTIASINGANCSVNEADLSGVATVMVRDVVSASISGSVSTCNSEPATININVTGDGPWFGTLSDGTAFSGNNNVISVVVNPLATSVYSISSLNGEYCMANPNNLAGNTTVFINELVTGTISGNNTICKGASSQLSITVTGKGPWSGTLNNGMTFSGSVSPIVINVSPTSTTTYSIASLNGGYCTALSSNLNGSVTIQVNNPTSSTTNVTVCNNQLPYNWNNNNYSAAGTYSVTLTGSNGCDSIATINLVVNAVTYSTTNMLLCSNQVPYVWNDISISNAGTYTKTLVNAKGCDSIATLNFLIKNISSSTTRLTLCSNNLPLVWNGLSLTSTGTYTRSFNNSVGCDSLAIIMLTVKQTSNIVDYVSAVGSYTWHGTTYTSSNNTAMWTGVNAAGCDSTVRLDLTITYDCTETDSTLNVTACKVYIWKGIRSTTSTTLEWIGVNAGGCDSVVTLNLTITTLAPTVAPASITQTLVSNVCGAKVYRYTAAPSVNASGYQWILPNSVGGVSGVFVDSGDINNSITIRVRYTSNNAAITGDSIKVKAFSVCGSTTNRTVKLTNTLLTPPLAPASITATAISINTCGAKKYRYIAPALTAATATAAAATGFSWSFKGTLGENAFIDSGDIGSQVITVTYSMNNAAATGDSVKVAYTSVCGNSVAKALKLTNTLLSAPLAPTTVTVTPVQTNICGARKYRYSASVLATATTTAMPATGWFWSLPAEGTVGSTGTIDSADVNSQTIVMKYTSNAAADAGDTIRVAFTSACGLSVAKATKLTNTSITAPLAPATVTVTPLVTNICGARRYRYSAAGLVASTTTATAATGWLWSLPAEGTVGSTGTKDSGEINSQTIVVTYSSNAAAAAGDTIRVAYTSSCGLGAAKATKLTNTLLGAPLAPLTVTIATVSDICGARVYRYTAPALPTATTTVGEAKGYLWSLPIGTLGLTGELDSGLLTSKVIRIRYSSNVAAATGDSIKVLYTSDCGNSPAKAQKLSNLAPTLLTAPLTLTGTTSICSVVGTSTSNRYIATAVTGALSYVWTLPAGAVLDSGSNGLKIKVRFLTAGANDSIYVQAVGANGCAGAKKVLKLVTTGCVTQLISRTNVPSATKATIEPMQVNVYPNPSTSAFQMFVKTPSTSKIAMRILDIQGRLIKTISFNSDETIAFGNDLKSGVYMVEVREGNVVKTVRVLKY